MILCDAGPLFALVDPRQAELHRRCKDALPGLSSPLVTTWPSFTEAMYLAHRWGGWAMQRILWRFVGESVLSFHEPAPGEAARMVELMERYRDVPMDLADASLVAAAEALGVSRSFTLDHHFRVYRIQGVAAFHVIP
ncbi:type II toxin-antitoxin system VapC family toxin [Paludisphaera soli]|uniref:type II toxin-antitoxin system VapC family toxin n=1 Tax=Paludisphaera soli TaxID=2712865 RepID=UPI0013EC211B|nr:PIN domain-containing protein [Paludisphaera soli]